jgi:DNA-binding NtrC family response regulator
MTNQTLEIAQAAVRLYAESHPRPIHVNQIQAAEMLGISRKTLSARIKKGWIRMNALGMIPIAEVDRVLAVHDNYTSSP